VVPRTVVQYTDKFFYLYVRPAVPRDFKRRDTTQTGPCAPICAGHTTPGGARAFVCVFWYTRGSATAAGLGRRAEQELREGETELCGADQVWSRLMLCALSGSEDCV
jgi:hypothetical protein